MDTTYISQFLAILVHNFYYFKVGICGHIQVGIIANIVSYITNYYFRTILIKISKLPLCKIE